MAFPITSGYGPRADGFHAGIDYGTPLGTPLGSPADGRVIDVKDQDGASYGLSVWIQDRARPSVVYLLAHLGRALVTPGLLVTGGQHVAYSGKSGNVRGVTGAHLHFEVRVKGKHTNPAAYVGRLFNPPIVGPLPPGAPRTIPQEGSLGVAGAPGALAYAPPGTYVKGQPGFTSLMRAPFFASKPTVTSITVKANGDFVYTTFGRPDNIFGRAAELISGPLEIAATAVKILANVFSIRGVYVLGGAILVTIGIVLVAKELGQQQLVRGARAALGG